MNKIEFNRQIVRLRVAYWANELVFATRGLQQAEWYLLSDLRFLEIQRSIARDQFNAAQDEQEEMDS